MRITLYDVEAPLGASLLILGGPYHSRAAAEAQLKQEAPGARIVEYTVEVDDLLSVTARCAACGGAGAYEGLLCRGCGGEGLGRLPPPARWEPCPACAGKGTREEAPCPDCRGSGLMIVSAEERCPLHDTRRPCAACAAEQTDRALAYVREAGQQDGRGGDPPWNE